MRGALCILVALLLAAPAQASEERPTRSELEAELMCPTCGTPLDQSNAPAAQRIKAFVDRRIAAGDTKSEIKEKLVAQFGTEVLAAPPKEGFNLLAWALPLGGVVLGAAAAAAAVWRWKRSGDREPARDEPLDPELERRLDAELGRLD